ncbi:tetratricopeptide repeat protein [Helicobacter heilmannii]|uniref:tetratricopeptide repeat protein n=1 Tax=Helicobacter heilmannii TaxID=35817 RepID=UPI001E2AB16A|nr:tetratricopeptide repeat protein [Helicobacter heilmannii]
MPSFKSGFQNKTLQGAKMLVVLKKRVWQVVLLWAMALGVCYAGQADRIVQQGRDAYKNQDYEQAFENFQKAADMGSAEGYLGLGMLYYKGEGVDKDYDQAFDCFEKATHTRNAEVAGLAYGALGTMYVGGQGTDVNCSKGLAYLRKAARLGNTSARDVVRRIERHQNSYETQCAAGAFLNLFGISPGDLGQ